MALRNIRIVVEYDGSHHYGWQLQKDKPTIQGELQRALAEITGHRTAVTGSGRTDSGVHAEGQVANFHTSSTLPVSRWAQALNAHLPPEISIRSAEEVPAAFHAQYGAVSKVYRYRLLNCDTRSALERGRAHLVRARLDLDAMRRAAAFLVGTHDFRAFGSEMSRKEMTVRTIFAFDIVARDSFVECLVHGDGFLYNQVRAMMGTILQVAMGKQPPEWVRQVLESRDRKQAGPNLPARGLTLVEVRY